MRQGQATTRTTGPAEVAVLGMIHGAHRTSELWGLDQVRETIRRLEPSAVLVEIPPDRWERIWRDFTERGVFEDERIALFPEYTDVLLPLALEQGFEIVPCAAWTREMADLRRARMASFESDEAFEAQRASYREAEARVAAELGDPPAREDDPQFIHSVEYDERTRKELGPYDEFMNEHIGPGGWTNINRAHMNLIEAAIEARRGQRLLITFGAGHKYWFLDALRENRGVRLIDVVPHLSGPEGGAGD